MSVGEVTSRIHQLQAQLDVLARPPVLRTGSTVLGGGFTAALDAASPAVGSSLDPPTIAATGWHPGAAGVTGPASAAGQQIVDEARRYLGVPYLWGGTDPAKGLDCSGLVQLVYRNHGVELPRVSYQQATAGRPVDGLAQARPGDILAFGSPVDHVAIYIGDNKMIEAPRTGLDVRVIDVYEEPTAIRRVLPDVAVQLSAAGGSSLPGGTPYARLFETAGIRHGVSPTLLAAVAQQESGFNPTAVSHAGARGLMQLMPATAAGLGVRDAMDPAQAVDGAARLLKDLISEFGRIDLALAAYNAGPGAVHRYDGIPPYPETRAYVPAVLAHQAALERR